MTQIIPENPKTKHDVRVWKGTSDVICRGSPLGAVLIHRLPPKTNQRSAADDA